MPRTLSVIHEVPEEHIVDISEDIDQRMRRIEEQDPGAYDRFMDKVNREIVAELNREIEEAEKMELFLSQNEANTAALCVEKILAYDPSIVDREFRQRAQSLEVLDRGLIDFLAVDNSVLYKDLSADLGEAAPGRASAFLFWLVFALGVSLPGIILIVEMIQSHLKNYGADSLRAGGVTTLASPPLNVNQTTISLLMQAAADRPVNFADFGITADAYSSIRSVLLESIDRTPELAFWSSMADAAVVSSPVSKAPFTLADHYLLLAFLFEFYAPLCDPQPVDIDLADAIDQLAAQVTTEHAAGPAAVYDSMMQVIPDSSGASRLLRIFLAKAAIARALVAA